MVLLCLEASCLLESGPDLLFSSSLPLAQSQLQLRRYLLNIWISWALKNFSNSPMTSLILGLKNIFLLHASLRSQMKDETKYIWGVSLAFVSWWVLWRDKLQFVEGEMYRVTENVVKHAWAGLFVLLRYFRMLQSRRKLDFAGFLFSHFYRKSYLNGRFSMFLFQFMTCRQS